jgi:hypothetical protein
MALKRVVRIFVIKNVYKQAVIMSVKVGPTTNSGTASPNMVSQILTNRKRLLINQKGSVR